MDEMPEPAMLFKAIDIYIRHAYAPGAPPKTVAARIEQLHQTDPAGLFQCPAVEGDRKNPHAGRHEIRLGNRFYPHMKLSIEERPDHLGYLFRADTHDRHVRPAEGSREAAMFREIVERNAALAKEIETAWADAGIPTFRTYLREDLTRRAAEARRAAKGGPG
jgi:hypothetical protein